MDVRPEPCVAERLPVAKPALWGDEERLVLDALRSGWISSAGPYVEAFEHAFAERIGMRHAVAVTSATAALHLALETLRIGPGDEVIVPAFTMMAPVFAVLYQHAVPVPVDADATWNLDPELVARAITPRTKAILAVHIYGHPADARTLRRIADERGVALVEDVAEGFGATIGETPAGAFGDVSCFSFYANKLISTGEGGMLLARDGALAERARWKRSMCFGDGEEARYDHAEVGFNYRMTNLQAALGVAQLRHADEAYRRRTALAARYTAALGAIDGIGTEPRSAWTRSSHWAYGITVGKAFGRSRAEVQHRLAERGIETRRFFTPLHRQRFAAGTVRHGEAFPVAERLHDAGCLIPLYPEMADADADRVVEELRRCAS